MVAAVLQREGSEFERQRAWFGGIARLQAYQVKLEGQAGRSSWQAVWRKEQLQDA